jgi:hypothetical protein
MTLFYDSRNLWIDEREYVTPGGSYRHDDLSNVHVFRGRPDQLPRAGMHAAAGASVLALAVGPLLNSPAAYMLGILTLLLILGASGVSLLKRRPRWEIRASHQGVRVCLLSTTDERTFGQVRRGLLRALEANQRV